MAAKQVLLVFLCSQLFPVLAAPPEKWKTLSIIRKVNQRGPYVGLITVYPPEENAFFASGAFKPDRKYPYIDLSGRRFRVGKVDNKKVIYVKCGKGMVNAAAATQQMLDLFNIGGVVHFGIAGNSNNTMSIGDVSIPKQFANTGLWDWLKPNGTLPKNDVAQLDFESFNVPKGENSLGHLGYSPEQFYSESGEPNNPEKKFWFQISDKWLQLASRLEGMGLEQCINATICLPKKPKLVVGLRGSSANHFIDNAAYREFVFQNFHVSSVDMESASVVMTSLSNGYPVIVIRGLSDLAGAQEGNNTIYLFGPLAATNVANAVVQFVRLLPDDAFHKSQMVRSLHLMLQN